MEITMEIKASSSRREKLFLMPNLLCSLIVYFSIHSTPMLPHVYIGPIWDLFGLEYRPHMGKTCGIHIGNENGSHMGFIWDSIWDPCLSQIHYTCFPYGSHILPIWIPHECQMFPKWLSCKSWFNPRLLGCILLMFSVFLWCMPDVLVWVHLFKDQQYCITF